MNIVDYESAPSPDPITVDSLDDVPTHIVIEVHHLVDTLELTREEGLWGQSHSDTQRKEWRSIRDSFRQPTSVRLELCFRPVPHNGVVKLETKAQRPGGHSDDSVEALADAVQTGEYLPSEYDGLGAPTFRLQAMVNYALPDIIVASEPRDNFCWEACPEPIDRNAPRSLVSKSKLQRYAHLLGSPDYDLVVTRHQGLVDYLRDQGRIDDDTPVVEHVERDDVEDKETIGVLPMSLAVHAAAHTEVELQYPPEYRGEELDAEQVREYEDGLYRYKVSRSKID